MSTHYPSTMRDSSGDSSSSSAKPSTHKVEPVGPRIEILEEQARKAVARAKAEAKAAGLGIPMTIDGKLVWELPDGSITDQDPNAERVAAERARRAAYWAQRKQDEEQSR